MKLSLRQQKGQQALRDVPSKRKKNFWNKDHKLGISASIILSLYKAAKLAFMIAFKQYKMCGDQSDEVGNCLPASSSCDDLQSILVRHNRSLLLLSCDFMTAWNCRKLVVSKEKQHSMLLDELHLFVFVLSYSPKSEQAWNHSWGALLRRIWMSKLKVEEPKFLFEAKTVQRMELLVLSTLQCRMNPVTPISFLEHIVRRIGLKTLLHWEFLWKDSRFMGYLPSTLVAATMIHVIKEIELLNAMEYINQLMGLLKTSEVI
ncbi:uncharacterized protein [Arachis hypogaea]|uniref:uncharacterized protein isoform X4 n=1 Tax=Arachis hypogaea TaxID=3818 RepID=UPI0010FC4A19|nr:uncharacterized protein LOC112703307 isoform X2 [Arachis hypogaea]